MCVLVVFVATGADTSAEGFGGGAAARDPEPDDAVCVVQTDDGRWRPCSDILGGSTAGAAPEEDAETRALRDRMRALDSAAPQAEMDPPTRLEEELARGGLDASLPLLALRVEVARAEQRVALLEGRGRAGRERELAEESLGAVRALLDDVERIALNRMGMCAARRGNQRFPKSYRMTPGGPVQLTPAELMAALALTDPEGCGRIFLVDAATVERVRRMHHLRHTLTVRQFGYRDVAERRALERELVTLERELGREMVPVGTVPRLGPARSR